MKYIAREIVFYVPPVLSSQPENVLTFDVIGSAVPEVKLIHFERSREVSSDTDLVINRLDDHIEYEGKGIADSARIQLILITIS